MCGLKMGKMTANAYLYLSSWEAPISCTTYALFTSLRLFVIFQLFCLSKIDQLVLMEHQAFVIGDTDLDVYHIILCIVIFLRTVVSAFPEFEAILSIVTNIHQDHMGMY
jgi:hypothetical protein